MFITVCGVFFFLTGVLKADEGDSFPSRFQSQVDLLESLGRHSSPMVTQCLIDSSIFQQLCPF